MFTSDILDRLLERKNLSTEEAKSLMQSIMQGELSQVRTAAILAALRTKGETVEEITGFAAVMRENAARVLPRRKGLVDTCGTGGDARRTFNISTAAAIVAAGAGIAIAKHGNRAVSSKCGSADVLQKLGVKIDLSPASSAALIDEIGIGFLFAPIHHLSMKHAAPVRSDLGVRTVFNLLGPLVNPLGVKRQLVGVFNEELTETAARVLKAMGSEKVYAVHGRDGTDEVSITDKTVISSLENGSIKTFTFSPEDAGLSRAKPADIEGGMPDENAAFIEDILHGSRGPHRDVVLLNCAFVSLAAGKTATVIGGMRLAEESIDSGQALRTLEILRETSQALGRKETKEMD